MKYIDSEKLIAEIERLKSQLVRGACAAGIAMETNCKEEAYNEVLAFIDSLPAESPDFEAEWKRYTASRKDDLRNNAVTMNVKEVAKHFAEWQKEQMMDEWISVKDALPPVNAEVIVLSDVFNGTYIKASHVISYGHIVDKRYCVDYDGWNIPGVTHWIPCPKLPEDDSTKFYPIWI